MTNKGKVALVKDKLNNIIFPKTKTKAITNDLGIDLDTLLALKAGAGGDYGIPILSKTQLDSIDGALPTEYLLTSTPTDLDLTIAEKYIKLTEYGNLVQVLFSSIRKLLSEIALLKNTFYYGLISLNESNTAREHIYEDTDEEEEEPLWAIDPEDLSELSTIDNIQISATCNLPTNTWTYTADNNYVEIGSTISEYGDFTIDGQNDIYPKVLFYSIIEPNSDWEFNIKFSESKILKILDLIGLLKISILFCLSRRVESEDTTYNKNFYWISISDSSGNPLKQIYFKNDLSLSEVEIDEDSIDLFTAILLKNLKLYKLDFYSKEVSFSSSSNQLPELIDTSENIDFMLRPSHITIRKVSSYENLLLLTDYLLENELIWCTDSENGGLYIKSNGLIVSVGTSGGTTTSTYLSINKTTATTNIGDTIALVVATNSTATITYSSSNTNIATVDSSGIVTAIAAGTVTITVSIEASGIYTAKSVSCVITINENSLSETAQWEFGQDFPIIFTDDNTTNLWLFGQDFPITFTDDTIIWNFGLSFPITF